MWHYIHRAAQEVYSWISGRRKVNIFHFWLNQILCNLEFTDIQFLLKGHKESMEYFAWLLLTFGVYRVCVISHFSLEYIAII